MDLEKKRLAVHKLLCDILGNNNCYYSPPTNMEMHYPCVVYHLDGLNPRYADNIRYLPVLQWSLTVIDEEADSEIANRFMNLQHCSFNRSFASDDLNHFAFQLYY